MSRLRNIHRIGKWNMRGGHGNIYRYNDADHKHRMGSCKWLPKDGDLCLRVRDSGDCFHDYIALRETTAGQWGKVGEFGAYIFGEAVRKLDERTFHLACAGDPISLPNNHRCHGEAVDIRKS